MTTIIKQQKIKNACKRIGVDHNQWPIKELETIYLAAEIMQQFFLDADEHEEVPLDNVFKHLLSLPEAQRRKKQ